MKKLKDPEEPIERILGRARRLGPALGPVLYQLPRGWKCNLERLAHFFAALPRDLLHVVEFRRPDWLCDDVFKLMREFQIGLCIHDLLPNHPRTLTSDVVYVRFHGAGVKYGGSYSSAHLRRWATWLVAQSECGKRAFVYFNNDAQAHAVAMPRRWWGRSLAFYVSGSQTTADFQGSSQGSLTLFTRTAIGSRHWICTRDLAWSGRNRVPESH